MGTDGERERGKIKSLYEKSIVAAQTIKWAEAEIYKKKKEEPTTTTTLDRRGN
jgi:hypothetical protein